MSDHSPTYDRPSALMAWHAIVETRDPSMLDALLCDEVVFRSPALHAPQEGKVLTTMYLRAAMRVLGPTLSYLAEWYDDSSAVLEFESEIEEGGKRRTVHGVDMLRWNAAGQLTSFTVMVRPFSAMDSLMGAMVRELAH